MSLFALGDLEGPWLNPHCYELHPPLEWSQGNQDLTAPHSCTCLLLGAVTLASSGVMEHSDLTRKLI